MAGRLLPISLVLIAGGCAMRHQERLLAVGGVHALEGSQPCQLSRVDPASSLVLLGHILTADRDRDLRLR